MCVLSEFVVATYLVYRFANNACKASRNTVQLLVHEVVATQQLTIYTRIEKWLVIAPAMNDVYGIRLKYPQASEIKCLFNISFETLAFVSSMGFGSSFWTVQQFHSPQNYCVCAKFSSPNGVTTILCTRLNAPPNQLDARTTGWKELCYCLFILTSFLPFYRERKYFSSGVGCLCHAVCPPSVYSCIFNFASSFSLFLRGNTNK